MDKNKLTLVNFRDLGGLETPDGKCFKQGKLFRTAVIKPKTKADRNYIKTLQLDTVVDLRMTKEIESSPDKLPENVEYINVSALDEEKFSMIALSKKMMFEIFRCDKETLDEMRKVIIGTYEEMPFSKAYLQIFNRMDEGKTIAFHCTAGKDRTGVAAAVIELAMGRSLAQCRQQYLASNYFRKEYNQKIASALRAMRAKDYTIDFFMYTLTTHDECFDTAVKTVRGRYGSTEEYLQKTFDITKERIEMWKSFYLQ